MQEKAGLDQRALHKLAEVSLSTQLDEAGMQGMVLRVHQLDGEAN